VRALVLAPFAERWLDRLSRRLDVAYESWLETGRLQDPEELAARIQTEDVVALVLEADFAFEEVLASAPPLRIVAVCRNAVNHVDVKTASDRGVAVSHAPGRNTEAVVEMTIGLMLTLARGILPAHLTVSGGGWRDPALGYRRFRGREIAGSTVGVAGFGQIGRSVAQKCLALGARVLAHDPFVPDRAVAAAGATPVSREDLVATADFVTLHVSASPATRRLVDASFLSAMKRTAYLVNTSNGAAVDAAALAEALDRGQIAGAALDVFEGQPLPASSPLLTAPNVILTPHIGGATDETVERHSRMITGDIERLLDGKPLRHCVNPDYALARAR
jgi:phosphoglycerate dehydrogenase-like enzyme